ncbi:hypothetical protein J6590_074778 [Homalodisca vitripennis]|nr:hypothetical protein J6590_074778 [Homalodisca vitripennis]
MQLALYYHLPSGISSGLDPQTLDSADHNRVINTSVCTGEVVDPDVLMVLSSRPRAGSLFRIVPTKS